VGTLPAVAYNEQFNVANKGYLPSFVDDFSAVNWTMSAWAPQPPAAFGLDNADFFRTSGGGWGGVMIRENLMPGSKKVSMKTQMTTNIRREIRSVTNGAAAILNYIRPGHTWLRLERSGGNFVGYSSPDGASWSFAFTAPVSMTGCVYVGIFSESINNSVTNSATFDNVSVTGTPIPLVGNFNQLPVAESGDQVQIYPNPTTGELNIELDVYAGKPGVVQVFNVLGELVTQERLVAGNMETHNMRIEGSAGVYTVVIQLDEYRIVRRVVVDPGGKK